MKIEDFNRSASIKGQHSLLLKKKVLETRRPMNRGLSDESRVFTQKKRKPDLCPQKLYPVSWNVTRKLNFSTPIKRSRKNNKMQKGIVAATMTILSWLIDTGVVKENTEVHSTKKAGMLKRGGILCFCCNKVLPIDKFHIHGGRRYPKPYENIYVAQTGVPLVSYMAQAWDDPRESSSRGFNDVETSGDSYDDVCIICADGGNLMCCDGCRSTYHQVCLEMEDVPEDSWYCPYCVCKFCAQPFSQNDPCPQCEKRYHPGCQKRMMDLNKPPAEQFCEPSCREVFEKLTTTIVGKRNMLDEGYSWTLLHRLDNDHDTYTDDIYSWIMCHSKLAVARKLMEECFEPIQDRHTKVKVIPSVIYNCGSNFRRVSFKGFYTAVLEKDDKIISAASLRFHGTKLAEMPFIATDKAFRRQGMCKKLVIAIDTLLRNLEMEYLIIPSVPEKVSNWLLGYGFLGLDGSMRREIMLYNTLTFHDSVRLQKLTTPLNIATP